MGRTLRREPCQRKRRRRSSSLRLTPSRPTRPPAQAQPWERGRDPSGAGQGRCGDDHGAGVLVSDNQNSLRTGERGPTLLEDFAFREKILHFDHERIPERVVHARGYGAHGYFEATDALADLTMAAPFQEKGKRTPAFVRFSTVAGAKGSADLARDVRGFAVKLYTEAGNWDLVGNNIPVFFIQDAMKFPDLIHAVKDEPDRGFPQAASAHDNFGISFHRCPSRCT